MNKKAAYELARTDPRQQSFFGEDHAKELSDYYQRGWFEVIQDGYPENNKKVVGIVNGRVEELIGYFQYNGRDEEPDEGFLWPNRYGPVDGVTHWKSLEED